MHLGDQLRVIEVELDEQLNEMEVEVEEVEPLWLGQGNEVE